MSTLKVDTIVSDTTPTVNFTDGLNVTGVATATNFKTGSTNVHNTGVELANINTGAGAATFGGQINVGTAATIAANGNATFSGIVTATTYYGSGTNLTGITGTTINNNANDRLITGSGTANTLEGEQYLTFNGTGDLTVTGDENTAANLILVSDQSDNTADEWRLSSQVDNLFSIANDDSGSFVNKVEMHKAGNVTITQGNLVMGTAGKGIDFSAQTVGSATGVTVASELLDHYEEGSWTPDFRGYHHSNGAWQSWTMTTAGTRTGYYVRIGQLVCCWAKFEGFQPGTGLSYVSVMGLPYVSSPSIMGNGASGYCDCFDQTDGAPMGTVSSSAYFNVIAVSPNDTHNMILSTSSNRTYNCGFHYRTTG